MPIIYDKVSCLVVLLISLLLAFLLSTLLMRYSKLTRGHSLLIVFLPSAVIAYLIAILVPFIGQIDDRTQAVVAQPYIQQALDEQCGLNQFVADTDGFYFEYKQYDSSSWLYLGPSFNWRSEDSGAYCIHIRQAAPHEQTWLWDCDCP